MTERRNRGKRREPVRRDEYGGRGANIAGIIVMGVFGLGALLSIFGVKIPYPSVPLPEQLDSTPARILLFIAGMFLAFILGAMLLKWLEVRKAAAWPSTAGRIVRSRRAMRASAAAGDSDAVERPFADIEFEYEVEGVLYAGERTTLAENQSEDEIAAMLARYPVGARVHVFYDPADPSDSVLERAGPKVEARGCILALGVAIAGVFFLMRVLTEGPQYLLQFMPGLPPDANPGVALFGGLMALGFLTPAILWARLVAEAARWPATPGVVLSTAIRSNGGSGARAHYPIVTYRYAVDGVERTKSNLSHGLKTGGGRGWAEKVLARYPVGARIDVRYDPADPERTSLETRFGFIGWCLFLIGVLLLVGALLAAGLL